MSLTSYISVNRWISWSLIFMLTLMSNILNVFTFVLLSLRVVNVFLHRRPVVSCLLSLKVIKVAPLLELTVVKQWLLSCPLWACGYTFKSPTVHFCVWRTHAAALVLHMGSIWTLAGMCLAVRHTDNYRHSLFRLECCCKIFFIYVLIIYILCAVLSVSTDTNMSVIWAIVSKYFFFYIYLGVQACSA